MSSIGDIVLTTPLIRSFKKKFPGSSLDFVVRKEFAELLRHNPHIDTLHEFDTKTGIAGLRSLANRLRHAGYDLVIDAHDNLRSRFIRRRCKGRKTVRIRKRIIPRFFLIQCKWNLYRDHVHVVDRYIEPVEFLGVSNDNEGLELHIPGDIEKHVADQFEELKKNSDLVVAICPSAKHYTKRWLKEYYVDLAQKLVSAHNACIVILGGPEDHSYCEDVKRLIGGERAVNVAGSASLLQAAAIFDHCDIVVSNDTGLMHIATSRKRNVVALFGPTVRELGFFPYGNKSVVVEHTNLSCRPCTHIGSNECPKGHFRCMKEIEPDRVLDAVRRFIPVD